MAFDISHLAPAVGSVVTGLDLARDMSEPTMRRLINLLFDRGVVVIPDQRIDEADYVRFAGHFGTPLDFFIPEHRDAAFPSIIRISNDPRTPPEYRDGAVHWHSDSSYESVPGAVTMLYGKEAPDQGGETHFASTSAAYEALPEAMKARLEGLVALHELGRAPWIDGETRPDPNRAPRKTDAPRHPLVMAHPVTGRKGIFTSGTAYAVEGMGDGAAIALIRELREHIVRPAFRTSYKVRAGDVVLWDNFGTVHCATPIEYSAEDGKRRLLQRISTKGLPALCDPA
jgi:taurine dioxygenase